MGTIRRLTTAQAIASWLGAQDVERDGARAVHRRRLRHLRARQRGGHGRGARGGGGRTARTRCATSRRATSRGWSTRRPPTPSSKPPDAGLRVHHAPSVPAPRTWSRAPRWPRSTACPCCCSPATCSPPAASRPVLQQLERPESQDVSVNDVFKPVSRYWDRINRPEQLLTALPARVPGADLAVRDGRRDPRAAPGRPGGGVRLPDAPVRGAHLGRAAPAPGRHAPGPRRRRSSRAPSGR